MSKNNLDTDVLKVAMYLRLSQDDEKYDKGFKVESNSISNQRLQLKDFIDKNEDMELIEEYVDDGYSGINFERPAFKLIYFVFNFIFISIILIWAIC